jgi:hypothetical protein
MLARFLAQYHPFLHALEINGFRPWQENREVLALAAAWGLPVVAGGDRHGAAPNMVLNLTAAETIGEFAYEIRRDRVSDIVLMPAYTEPRFTKEFRTASDALAFYPDHPEGRRAWPGRVFFEEVAGCPKSVGELMTTGMPGWLRTVTHIAGSLGNGPLYRLLNATLPRERIDLTETGLNETAGYPRAMPGAGESRASRASGRAGGPSDPQHPESQVNESFTSLM